MIQLEDGKSYWRTDGEIETVQGRTRDYKDWVWTSRGNWYERATGFEIYCNRLSPTLAPRDGRNLVAEVP